MTAIPWYAFAVFIVAVVGVAWIGIRRTERFRRWADRRLRKEQAALDPAIDQGFAAKVKPEDNARMQ